jgi:Ca2+-transporting ATPase
MIPQGLPAEVNISLAQAAGKLAKSRALVKKLSAVETLGATNLICTDKTGTLTKNEMTVEQLLIGGKTYYVSGTGYESNGAILDDHKEPLRQAEVARLELFFATGIMASNAQVSPPDHDHPDWYVLGDPTEGALITLARKAGLDDRHLNETSPELREFPFDSARKLMSSVRRYNGRMTLFVKGAPESVLYACDFIAVGGRVRKMTAKDRADIMKRNDDLASHAMRNLGFAYKLLPANLKADKLTMEAAESKLVFLGMSSMIDPPRDEVYDAMQAAQNAGIPVTIVTGDNPLTAKAIALKVGLAREERALTLVLGSELHDLSDEAVGRLLERGKVIFSRVAPEDKLRIVDIAKSIGRVVAVTGDGINDAPALKRADIGVAMGRTGTDVAKDSAEIILLDDSFKTLVGAIQSGRVIFQNIRKATICAISSNGGELVAVLLSMLMQVLFHIPMAIGAVEILAIDLMAELFPIAALGWDPAEHDLMQDPPRRVRDHILSWPVIFDLVRTGLIMGGLAYANYLFFIWRHGFNLHNFNAGLPDYAAATALTYVTICLCQFANILLRRVSPGRSIFSRYLWSNWHLLAAFGFSLAGILNIVYNPWLQPFFRSGNLNLSDWLCAITAGLIYLMWRQTTSRLSAGKKSTKSTQKSQVSTVPAA